MKNNAKLPHCVGTHICCYTLSTLRLLSKQTIYKQTKKTSTTKPITEWLLAPKKFLKSLKTSTNLYSVVREVHYNQQKSTTPWLQRRQDFVTLKIVTHDQRFDASGFQRVLTWVSSPHDDQNRILVLDVLWKPFTNRNCHSSIFDNPNFSRASIVFANLF